MNQEDSSVLELLRQAVEAATGDKSVSLDSPVTLPGVAMGVEDSIPGAASPVAASVAKSLSGLVSGSTGQSGWEGWVSRVNPIAGLVAGLFGGGGETAAAAPVQEYLRPESLRLEAGFDGASDPEITTAARQDGGQYRQADPANGGAQVVVQVQAMDSRSFLDYTPEIAEAVKRALLESSGLRDVIGEN